MLDTLIIKIRALIEDFPKKEFEVYDYNTSTIFTLCESNISSIDKVLKNGSELGSGDYSYDSDTNKIEILVSLSQGDVIEVDYTCYKYSDSELTEYIRGALVWFSIANCCDDDFELEEDINAIVPTPNNRELDLIAVISAIVIKPNYSMYRLPNLTIRYPRNMSKEEKIQSIINKFISGIGVTDTITLE